MRAVVVGLFLMAVVVAASASNVAFGHGQLGTVNAGGARALAANLNLASR